MSAVILHRIDHAKNMHRYYRLDVQPNLFGEWSLVREWGRIGQAGRYRAIHIQQQNRPRSGCSFSKRRSRAGDMRGFGEGQR